MNINEHKNSYSTIKGGSSSTATVIPYPVGYQRRIPGKILKVKIWKISKDFDNMMNQAIKQHIFTNSEPIFVSSRKAK